MYNTFLNLYLNVIFYSEILQAKQRLFKFGLVLKKSS